MSAVTPALAAGSTPRMREEHPMPDDLAARLGELIRGARPAPPARADAERT